MSTDIEWTDETWNPVTGCTKVSPGCDNCYAEGIATRFAGTKAFPRGFDVTLHPERLDAPLRWRKPRRVFVNSMSDLFHKDVPDDFIGSVWDAMARTPQHTYQILTKRPARARALLNKWGKDRMWRRADLMWCGPVHWPLPNVWLGVSVENQQWGDIRIPALLETPAAVRFLSCEPLLGPVDLKQAVRTMGSERGHGLTASYVHVGDCCHRFHGIDWVIVGGESGPKARPMHADWPRQLRDQCTAAGVPFFFKQWGNWAPVGPDSGAGHSTFDYVTNDDRVQVVTTLGEHRGRPWPGWRVQDGTRDATVMRRYAKHTAGRLLDGRTWDEFPESREVTA